MDIWTGTQTKIYTLSKTSLFMGILESKTPKPNKLHPHPQATLKNTHPKDTSPYQDSKENKQSDLSKSSNNLPIHSPHDKNSPQKNTPKLKSQLLTV